MALEKLNRVVDKINKAVAKSSFGYYFRLEGSGHRRERQGSRFLTEIRAGLTTWAAMAYIISVNASIMSDSGGTCVCNDPDDPSCDNNLEYTLCVQEIRQELITATAAISALCTFLMGALANLPVGMAPGLGLNSYFAYSIVGYHGTGIVPYRDALAAVFLEGWLFMILSILGIRMWLARAIPQCLSASMAAGIGMYIAFVGLSSSGLNVIGGNYDTVVGLAGCTTEYQDPDHSKFCTSHVLQSPTTWLGIFVGGVFTAWMLLYRVKGAIIIAILLVSIISWPRPTKVTYFPHTESGDELFDFFKQVVTFKPIKNIGGALNFNYNNGHVWYALISFLYVDLLDATATLYAMARYAGLVNKKTRDFEKSTIAYCVDAFSISMGSLMGVSPVTAYIESSTGISEGGKTGITAMTTGLAFFVSVFFSPIFASIPSWATGGALVLVGAMMMRNVLEVNWFWLGDAIPSFLAIIIIPLTYNIAYGVIASIISYILLNTVPALLRKLTGNRISPPGWETERTPYKPPPGGLVPLWIKKVKGGNYRVWESDDEDDDEVALEEEEKAKKNTLPTHLNEISTKASTEDEKEANGGVATLEKEQKEHQEEDNEITTKSVETSSPV